MANGDLFIDTTGKLVIPCIYDDIYNDFTNGINLIVVKDGKKIVIDKDGTKLYDYQEEDGRGGE